VLDLYIHLPYNGRVRNKDWILKTYPQDKPRNTFLLITGRKSKRTTLISSQGTNTFLYGLK